MQSALLFSRMHLPGDYPSSATFWRRN